MTRILKRLWHRFQDWLLRDSPAHALDGVDLAAAVQEGLERSGWKL